MKQMVKNWKQLEDLEDKIIGTKNGDIQIGKNLEVDGKTILNSSDDLVDKDGNRLIPETSNLVIFDTATVPASLIENQESREATESEVEWIKKYCNYVFFKVGTNNYAFFNVPVISHTSVIQINTILFRTSGTTITANKYWKLSYSESQNTVTITAN